jgi:hypothetical protein
MLNEERIALTNFNRRFYMANETAWEAISMIVKRV